MYLKCTGKTPDDGCALHCATCYRDIDRIEGVDPVWAYIPIRDGREPVVACLSHEYEPHPGTLPPETRGVCDGMVSRVTRCVRGLLGLGGQR